jgi:fatty acid amide hydrolase 2
MTSVAAPSRPLTELSATALAGAIRAGETSARAVVEAHIERLRAVGPRVNAIAADRFDAALEDADAADARIAQADDPGALPPLLGVPCTIKESIALRGMPNCAGLLSRREHRATETAPAAARLLAAGAIPLGVTNTSELTMWIESANYVYRRTRNAYDPARVAGGSSGGEGAAIGSGGSPIGLGSDIGGSIRLPAFFNGIFAHKPTPGLVPNTGQFPTPRATPSACSRSGRSPAGPGTSCRCCAPSRARTGSTRAPERWRSATPPTSRSTGSRWCWPRRRA